MSRQPRVTTLVQRCAWFVTHEFTAEDLRDFVISEMGRAADASLDDTKALVLYLADDASRKALVAAIHAEMPNMIERKWP